ncbi:uncharacterized protein L203_101374 [Cryptococcus depauperatus CBS 7841]|uniref:Uncharacterized protein n=1 Tax=Cryptococcus depauperatus CBS 7841 TaxID=1295531 RepID=A0AAJ8JPS1_9TREE
MTFYHVFLPPLFRLEATDVDKGHSLEFRQLRPDPQVISSVMLKEEGSAGIEIVGAAMDESSRVLGKRRAGEDKSMVSSCLSDTLAEPRNLFKPTRRSQRLASRDSSLLGPSQAQTASFDSTLDTTGTFPSQLSNSGMEDSIYHFPTWSIPLSKLCTLQDLLNHKKPLLRQTNRWSDKQLYTVILCIVSVDPSVERQRKISVAGNKQKGNGLENTGTLWIGKWMVIVPPTLEESEVSCTVKLWDKCAKDWGDEMLRCGDVVLVENVELKPSSAREGPHLVLACSNSPKVTVLYRTLARYTTPTLLDYAQRSQAAMPAQDVEAGSLKSFRKVVKEDKLLRPDLRLGKSDMGVRVVGDTVAWFESWLSGSS